MVKRNSDEARVLADRVNEWATINNQIDDPYVSGLVTDLYSVALNCPDKGVSLK